MKVFLSPPEGLSLAMSRVAYHLAVNAPDCVDVVSNEDDADVVVLHVIGYPETVEHIEHLRARGQEYIINQYCLRSTQRPSTFHWIPLWCDAKLVWSYYDLAEAIREDFKPGSAALSYEAGNFYIAPLGADSAAFKLRAGVRPYQILTSGYVAESEGVKEAVNAVERFGGQMLHLGPDLKLSPVVTWRMDISDQELAELYGYSRYVAGLRRCEGFELPAAEGLLCGARPIMFDVPHYRMWFEEHADFVKEGTFEEVSDALLSLFHRKPKPVTQAERNYAAGLFSWPSIVQGFWERVV